MPGRIISPALPTICRRRVRDLAAEEIREVELWDLVSAFGRVVRDSQADSGSSNIVYDDTPIHVYMAEIQARLLKKGQLRFPRPVSGRTCTARPWSASFWPCLSWSATSRFARSKTNCSGEIWILPGQAAATPLDATTVDNYDHRPSECRPPAAADNEQPLGNESER